LHNPQSELCNLAGESALHFYLVPANALHSQLASPLTTEWYNEMIALLDTKLERLKL